MTTEIKIRGIKSSKVFDERAGGWSDVGWSGACLDLAADLVRVLGAFGISMEITCQHFSILNGFKDGIFNDGCMSVKIHVPQHHDSTQQKSSWIGQVLSCYIGGGAMNRFEDGTIFSDVTTRGDSQTSNETCAKVAEIRRSSLRVSMMIVKKNNNKIHSILMSGSSRYLRSNFGMWISWAGRNI